MAVSFLDEHLTYRQLDERANQFADRLRALGVGDDLAHSSIRFSVGRFSTEQEVDDAADTVIRTVRKLRDMSPLYEMAQEGIDLSSVKWDAH